jgi:hypothetical protein
MKLLVTVLFLTGFSLAQTKADFSGIFLRTRSEVQGHPEPAVPRILEVKQTADEVVVTATQNGETAVARFRLHDKKSDTVQGRLQGKNLLLRTTVPRQWPVAGLIGPTVVPESLEEKWELSPDAQQLVILTKPGIGISDSDIYAREPSFDAAQAAARLAATTKCETVLPISALGKEQKTTWKYDQGADLGAAFFEQITHCVFYDAVLSGEFFKNLARTKESAQTRFRKKGEPVTAYTGDIVLEVGVHPWTCSETIGEWAPTGTPRPETAQDLRFMVRWLGAQREDLGEVPSEFLHDPWREANAPAAFYRLQIAAKDIPLADDLEVLIFSKSGDQLACVKGHL